MNKVAKIEGCKDTDVAGVYTIQSNFLDIIETNTREIKIKILYWEKLLEFLLAKSQYLSNEYNTINNNNIKEKNQKKQFVFFSKQIPEYNEIITKDLIYIFKTLEILCKIQYASNESYITIIQCIKNGLWIHTSVWISRLLKWSKCRKLDKDTRFQALKTVKNIVSWLSCERLRENNYICDDTAIIDSIITMNRILCHFSPGILSTCNYIWIRDRNIVDLREIVWELSTDIIVVLLHKGLCIVREEYVRYGGYQWNTINKQINNRITLSNFTDEWYSEITTRVEVILNRIFAVSNYANDTVYRDCINKILPHFPSKTVVRAAALNRKTVWPEDVLFYTDDARGDILHIAQENAVQDAAIQNIAVQNIAVQNIAVQDTAVQDTAVQDTAAQDTAVQDTAVQDTAVQDTAVQDTAVQDTAVQDTAVQDTAVQDTAVQDTAVQDTAVQETTVQETTVGDNTNEQKKINTLFDKITIKDTNNDTKITKFICGIKPCDILYDSMQLLSNEVIDENSITILHGYTYIIKDNIPLKKRQDKLVQEKTAHILQQQYKLQSQHNDMNNKNSDTIYIIDTIEDITIINKNTKVYKILYNILQSLEPQTFETLAENCLIDINKNQPWEALYILHELLEYTIYNTTYKQRLQGFWLLLSSNIIEYIKKFLLNNRTRISTQMVLSLLDMMDISSDKVVKLDTTIIDTTNDTINDTNKIVQNSKIPVKKIKKNTINKKKYQYINELAQDTLTSLCITIENEYSTQILVGPLLQLQQIYENYNIYNNKNTMITKYCIHRLNKITNTKVSIKTLINKSIQENQQTYNWNDIGDVNEGIKLYSDIGTKLLDIRRLSLQIKKNIPSISIYYTILKRWNELDLYIRSNIHAWEIKQARWEETLDLVLSIIKLNIRTPIILRFITLVVERICEWLVISYRTQDTIYNNEERTIDEHILYLSESIRVPATIDTHIRWIFILDKVINWLVSSQLQQSDRSVYINEIDLISSNNIVVDSDTIKTIDTSDNNNNIDNYPIIKINKKERANNIAKKIKNKIEEIKKNNINKQMQFTDINDNKELSTSIDNTKEIIDNTNKFEVDKLLKEQERMIDMNKNNNKDIKSQTQNEEITPCNEEELVLLILRHVNPYCTHKNYQQRISAIHTMGDGIETQSKLGQYREFLRNYNRFGTLQYTERENDGQVYNYKNPFMKMSIGENGWRQSTKIESNDIDTTVSFRSPIDHPNADELSDIDSDSDDITTTTTTTTDNTTTHWKVISISQNEVYNSKIDWRIFQEAIRTQQIIICEANEFIITRFLQDGWPALKYSIKRLRNTLIEKRQIIPIEQLNYCIELRTLQIILYSILNILQMASYRFIEHFLQDLIHIILPLLHMYFPIIIRKISLQIILYIKNLQPLVLQTIVDASLRSLNSNILYECSESKEVNKIGNTTVLQSIPPADPYLLKIAKKFIQKPYIDFTKGIWEIVPLQGP